MKILHINSYFEKRFFYKQLYQRQIRDHKIWVFIPTYYRATPTIQYEHYVMFLNILRKIDRFLYFTRIWKTAGKICSYEEISKADIIHAYSLFSNGASARIIANRLKIPYIVTIRNNDINFVFNFLFFLRPFGRKILQSASRVVFLSKETERQIRDKYCQSLNEESCVVVPNGVDDFWIKNQRAEYRSLDTKKLKFIYTGDVNKNKNVLIVAKVLDNYFREYNISYEIVGDVLDDRVAMRLQDYDFVHLKNRVNKEELIEIYKEADIYIMVSHRESFGISYLEAISQAVPVIYSKGQGFDGTFENGEVGYSANSRSEGDIKKAIENVILNYELLSKNCIGKINDYSWDRITKIYNKIYTEVIEGV